MAVLILAPSGAASSTGCTVQSGILAVSDRAQGDARGAPADTSNLIKRDELQQFSVQVDDKIECTRQEVLDRQMSYENRVASLENVARAVQDIPAVRAAAESALAKVGQVQENVEKIDERVDVEKKNLNQKIEQTADETKESLLSRLSPLRAEIEKNRDAGLGLKDSIEQAIKTRIAERVAEPGGSLLSVELAKAVGLSGPPAIGLMVLGYFLKRGLQRRAGTRAHR